MGVYGLTTFIDRNQKKYLRDFKLHGCYIVIDGNNLTYQIYRIFGNRARCSFGGDYDQYAQSLKDFFNLLSKCDIKPIVVFDGGYERRKLRTVIKRYTDRLNTMIRFKPASPSCPAIYPLFMKYVCREVLREMNIPFVQCDFEADQEIAGIARKYNCPLLSYDSDFFIYDVNYIPMSTLKFEAVPLNFRFEKTNDQFYLSCKMFKVEFFLNSFHGLDRSMLPLLSSLLGNDYVQQRVFRKFNIQFKSAKKKKGNRVQHRIVRVIEWLKHETFDSAVTKILGRTKLARRPYVKREIMKTLDIYTFQQNYSIEQYFPPEFTKTAVTKGQVICSEISRAKLNLDCGEGMDIDTEKEGFDEKLQLPSESSSSEDDDEENDDVDEGSGENEEKGEETAMDVELSKCVDDINETASTCNIKMPDWLTKHFHKGDIDPCVSDILTLRMYFTSPQMENNYFISSHMISIPLIKFISKLLLRDVFQSVNLWMKNKKINIQRFLLNLSNTPQVANIESIHSVPQFDRRALFLQCLGIPSDFCLDTFPEEWKLYFCAVLFWIKAGTELQITDKHLVSLIMSIVALSVIDSKVGFYKKKIDFLKLYGKKQKKIINVLNNLSNEECPNEDDADEDSLINITEISEIDSEPSKVMQLYSSINVNECIAVFDIFFKCRQVDQNLQYKGMFSKNTVHLFAQFQSCLYHAIILNSLLGHPFDRPVISRLYSGTFIYNMCSNLSKVTNTSEHLESLLKYSPNILKLVKSVLSEFSSVVQIVQSEPPVKRNKKRKRRKKASNEDKDDFCDEDNATPAQPPVKKKKSKQKKKASNESENDDVGEHEIPDNEVDEISENETSYQDENNTFSLLSIVE